MKTYIRFIAILIVIITVLSFPLHAFAVMNNNTDFSAFGETLYSTVNAFETDRTDCKEDNKVTIIANSTDAKIYISSPSLYYRITEYNILRLRWENVEFTNNTNCLTVKGLLPYSFHTYRIYAADKYIGKYSFITKPENIDRTKLDFSKKEVKIRWTNPSNYFTEIYKKTGDSKWKLIDTVKANMYTDTDIEPDNHYTYRIRYVCRTKRDKLYSQFSEFDEIYVPVEINNILEINGYIIIRQNDPLNKTIPYPYKDNGKTIGSSGCGACASLMIIRNLTDYEPTLESYVEKLIEIGARASYGNDINKISEYLNSEYNIDYTCTKSVDKLKKHLKSGGMAIAHVGSKKLFAKAGHFVVVAGIVKDEEENERAIILDPSFKPSKYQKQKRIDAGIEYSEDGIVTAPFETLLDDCKDEYFTLYTAK
ncbi:MAG: hypothetical protein E7571_03160 [Ruminococcaceae bacterium]|nr:hypothetical protein [Oscillospiraceae bacterium]